MVDVDKRLIGIVAVTDLALRQAGHIDKTVRQISSPEGVLSGTGAGTSPRDAAPH